MSRVTTKGFFGGGARRTRFAEGNSTTIVVLGLVAFGGVASLLAGYGWKGLAITALCLCVGRVGVAFGALLATVGELDLDGEE